MSGLGAGWTPAAMLTNHWDAPQRRERSGAKAIGSFSRPPISRACLTKPIEVGLVKRSCGAGGRQRSNPLQGSLANIARHVGQLGRVLFFRWGDECQYMIHWRWVSSGRAPLVSFGGAGGGAARGGRGG